MESTYARHGAFRDYKKFANLRLYIEFEDEVIMDQSKETDKVAFHVESAPPPPPSRADQWLREKSHQRRIHIRLRRSQ